ncbi:hypothetical protein ENUP19_0130G0031 [Entamoeba nuttalli]|uniref:Uncharacterized protein n=1 Tax=Entamoeba nuttalli TaxID=412467 RepID=A0ABQ0DJR9_9EUKA
MRKSLNNKNTPLVYQDVNGDTQIITLEQLSKDESIHFGDTVISSQPSFEVSGGSQVFKSAKENVESVERKMQVLYNLQHERGKSDTTSDQTQEKVKINSPFQHATLKPKFNFFERAEEERKSKSSVSTSGSSLNSTLHVPTEKPEEVIINQQRRMKKSMIGTVNINENTEQLFHTLEMLEDKGFADRKTTGKLTSLKELVEKKTPRDISVVEENNIEIMNTVLFEWAEVLQQIVDTPVQPSSKVDKVDLLIFFTELRRFCLDIITWIDTNK